MRKKKFQCVIFFYFDIQFDEKICLNKTPYVVKFMNHYIQ